MMGDDLNYSYNEDGSKYIGYHIDDEGGLDGCVYAFSYGVSRRFKFKNKATGVVDTVMLDNNSLLVMGENCQKTHKHSLPIMKKIKERRISVSV